jgi:hypothetical protein
MQWSKLKVKVKSFICSELADRIDFHLTSYRQSHDGADKVWILVDGQKVFDIKHYDYVFAEQDLYWNAKINGQNVKEILMKNEIYNPQDFGNSMREFLNLPIKDALQSLNPLIKAFAIIDKRIGKRTLENLEISDSDHNLVKLFYNLRITK